MSKNALIEKNIKSIGYDPKKFKIQYLFFEWYKKLFKLNPELNEKFETFRIRAKPTVNTLLICAQIRTGGETIANYKYDTVFNKYEETKKFWTFINETLIRNNPKFKLFVIKGF